MTRKSVPVAAVLSLIEKWTRKANEHLAQARLLNNLSGLKESQSNRAEEIESCIQELRALLPAKRK